MLFRSFDDETNHSSDKNESVLEKGGSNCDPKPWCDSDDESIGDPDGIDDSATGSLSETTYVTNTKQFEPASIVSASSMIKGMNLYGVVVLLFLLQW